MTYLEKLAARLKDDRDGVEAEVDDWAHDAAMESGVKYEGDRAYEKFVEDFFGEKMEAIEEIADS